jgi:urea transporter
MNPSTDWSGTISRIFLFGLALILGSVGLTDSRSLFSLVASTDQGFILMWVMIILGVVGVIDVLINDLMPQQFKWRCAHTHRHFLLALMAFCYVAQVYVANSHVKSIGLVIYLLWNAVSLMLVAFVDAHKRSKDATCLLVYN